MSKEKTNKVLGNIPQYVIKNILLVHNRKHPNKRMYNEGEEGIDKTVKWYLDNGDWLLNITSGEYQKYYEAMYK